MKTNQLEAFIEIAEGKGLAGAAEALHVTQPAITKSMKNLEDELRVALFDRTSNRLEINQYGQILFRHVKAVRAELRLAVEEINFMKRHSRSLLKINASPSVTPKLIPKSIHQFRTSYPDACIDITGRSGGSPKDRLSGLINGEYDLMIGVINELERLPGIRYEKLLDFEILFFASENHEALTLETPSLKQLQNYSWLFPASSGLPYHILRAAFQRENLGVPKDTIMLADRGTIFSLLDEGDFIAALPFHPACFEKDFDTANVITTSVKPIKMPVYLISRESTLISSVLESFIEVIQDIVNR